MIDIMLFNRTERQVILQSPYIKSYNRSDYQNEVMARYSIYIIKQTIGKALYLPQIVEWLSKQLNKL